MLCRSQLTTALPDIFLYTTKLASSYGLCALAAIGDLEHDGQGVCSPVLCVKIVCAGKDRDQQYLSGGRSCNHTEIFLCLERDDDRQLNSRKGRKGLYRMTPPIIDVTEPLAAP